MEPRSLDEIAASVVLAIAVIVVVARLLGQLLRRVQQPVVVAEIMAGVLLGPSLLGQLPGDPTTWLFPVDSRPFLTVVATIGLVVFMFIVGLELNLDLVRGKGRVALTVSVCSVTLPFALGGLLALWLHPRHEVGAGGEPVALLPFTLFLGAAMSVTAFPVLARILSERSMHRTPTGALALACAAVDDVLAWILLAVVLAVTRSSGAGDLLVMVVESIAFVLAMAGVVRPQLRRLVRWREEKGRLTPDVFAIVLVGVLVSSYITDKIGIHAIFGAFLFGAVMPRHGAEVLSHEILERVEQMTVLLLLPVFFITTGLNVDITGLGADGLVELLAVLAVACVGKFVGASVAARASGVHARRATAIGVLMNTRGLTELVILNIGLAVGVLDRQLFTILVIMAIATTVITEPVLRRVYPPKLVRREIAQAEKAALGPSAGYRVVAAVGDAGAEQVVDLSVALLGDEPRSQVVISVLLPPAAVVEVGSGLGAELAAIASSFESSQALVGRAEGAGASAVVRSQFADDVDEGLLELVRAADPEVLVLGRGETGVPDALMAEVDCVVVWFPDPASSRVVVPAAVQLGPGAGAAAVEQAVRAALSTRAELVLLDDGERRTHRRLEGWQRQLAGLPLTVLVVPESASREDALTFVDWSDPHTATAAGGAAGWTVVVRGAPGDHGERLAELVKRAGTRNGSAAGPT